MLLHLAALQEKSVLTECVSWGWIEYVSRNWFSKSPFKAVVGNLDQKRLLQVDSEVHTVIFDMRCINIFQSQGLFNF